MECIYCNKKPCECAVTELAECPTLPGALVTFRSATCTGSHEDIFGVGDMSLALHRPDHQYTWIDLGNIFYSNPTPEQYLDTKTAPPYTPGAKAHSNHHRRLSKKQAELLVKMINQMIVREFPNGIPPDDEINLR